MPTTTTVDGTAAAVLAELPAGLPATMAAFAVTHPDELAGCEHLDPDTWRTLWDRRRDAETAARLAGRPLTGDQLGVVVGTETRHQPLEAALTHNRPGPDHWERLAASAPARLAGRLCDDPTVPDTVTGRLARRADAYHQVWWHAGRRDVDDTDAADAVLAVPAGRPEGRWRRTIGDVARALAHTRPGSVDRLAAADATVTGVAGSWTLTAAAADTAAQVIVDTGNRYAASAFVHNPVVTGPARAELLDRWRRRHGDLDTPRATWTVDGTVDTVDDPTLLERLVAKCEPFDRGVGGYRSVDVGRPWHAVTLAANPRLDAAQQARLRRVLTLAGLHRRCGTGVVADARQAAWARLGGTGQVPDHTEAWIALPPVRHRRTVTTQPAMPAAWAPAEEVAATLAARLGDRPDAWRVALSMLDGFPGTLADLADLAVALSDGAG